jgi:hypothetical protein
MRNPDADEPSLGWPERSLHGNAPHDLDGHAILEIDPIAIHQGRDHCV